MPVIVSYSMYALRSMFRHKRRTITNAFGVFIATALLGSIFLYSNIISATFTTSALQGVLVDATVSKMSLSGLGLGDIDELTGSADLNLTKAMEYFDTDPLVAGSELFLEISSGALGIPNGNLSELHPFPIKITGINSSYLDTFEVFEIIEGEFPSSHPNGSLNCLLPYEAAWKLNVTVNETVSIQTSTWDFSIPTNPIPLNRTVNMTVKGILGVNPSSTYIGLLSGMSEFDLFASQNFIVIPFYNHSEWISSIAYGTLGLGFLGSTISESVHIRYDREVLPDDPNGINIATMAFQERFMREFAMSGEFALIMDNIQLGIMFLQLGFFFVIAFFLFLAIPAVFLGLYMQKFSVENTLESRRVEITMLKARGATLGQILWMTVLEVVLIAPLSAAAAFVVSGPLALIMTATTAFGVVDINTIISAPPIYGLDFTLLIGLVIIALLLSLFSTFLPTRTILRNLEITEGLMEEVSKKPPFWQRTYLDVFLAGLGVLAIVAQSYFEFLGLEMDLLLVILNVIGPIVFWIGGILVVSRLLKMLLLRSERWMTRILSEIDEILSVVIQSTVRRPEDLAKAIVMLALTFSFAVMVATTAETSWAVANSESLLEVGSDIQVSPPTPFNELDNLRKIPHVNSVSAIYDDRLAVGGEYMRIFGVNGTDFAQTAYLPFYFFAPGTSHETLRTLGPGEVIISNEIAKDEPLVDGKLGKEWLELEGYEVVGIMHFFPSRYTMYFIVISDADFLENVEASIPERYLIKTTSGRRAEVINSLIDGVEGEFDGYGQGLRYNTFDAALTARTQAGTFNLNGLLTIDFIAAVLVSCIGLGLFLMHVLQLRQKELGALMSMGATRRQIGLFIVGESIMSVLVSFIVGIPIGWGVAYLFNNFLPSTIPRYMQFPFLLLFVLVFVVLIGVAVSTLATLYRLRRISIAQVLRVLS